jgi:uncharacterized membrane protein YGL010W
MAATRRGAATAARAANENADNKSLCAALISYGEYHANFFNQIIHLICVPALLFTLLVGLAYIPFSLPPSLAAAEKTAIAASKTLPPWLLNDLRAGLFTRPLPLAAVLTYSLYYTLALDPFAGVCWTAVVGAPLGLGAVHLWRSLPQTAWQWALGIHILSWFLQIVPGHAILEGRRPALVDSFWQAIATAPLFVFLEVLFALGWNAPLRAAVNRGVEAALKKHKRRQAAVGKSR